MLKKNKLFINEQERYSSIRLIYHTYTEDLFSEPESAYRLQDIVNAIKVSHILNKRWKQREVSQTKLNKKKKKKNGSKDALVCLKYDKYCSRNYLKMCPKWRTEVTETTKAEIIKIRNDWIPVSDTISIPTGSGMKATAELPSRAEKAEPDLVFTYICSNNFKVLISFNLILPYM